MNYWTLVESNNIARERGVTFHNFEKSDYANGTYLISTRLENLYQNLIASKNSLKISLSQVQRIGQNCVLKFRQMVFTTKTAWLSHQMDLSATSMTYLLLSTQLHNGLKNAKRKKSVRSTTLQQDCQRKRFLTTLLPTTWICEKSSMSMLPQLNT